MEPAWERDRAAEAAIYPAGAVQLHFGRGAQETVLKSCEWKGVQQRLWYALLAKQCPYSPCFAAVIAGQQRKYVFAHTYTLYIAPGPVAIVTMATELSLISRVDTKVRNKALVAACGCRPFEQASAVLLAGCPGKKCDDAADTELAKSDVIQTGHMHLVKPTSGLLLGPQAPLVLMKQQPFARLM